MQIRFGSATVLGLNPDILGQRLYETIAPHWQTGQVKKALQMIPDEDRVTIEFMKPAIHDDLFDGNPFLPVKAKSGGHPNKPWLKVSEQTLRVINPEKDPELWAEKATRLAITAMGQHNLASLKKIWGQVPTDLRPRNPEIKLVRGKSLPLRQFDDGVNALFDHTRLGNLRLAVRPRPYKGGTITRLALHNNPNDPKPETYWLYYEYPKQNDSAPVRYRLIKADKSEILAIHVYHPDEVKDGERILYKVSYQTPHGKYELKDLPVLPGAATPTRGLQTADKALWTVRQLNKLFLEW